MGTQDNRTIGRGRQAFPVWSPSEIQRRIAVGNQRIARQQHLITIFARCGLTSVGSHQLLKSLQQLQALHERHRELRSDRGAATRQKDAAAVQ